MFINTVGNGLKAFLIQSNVLNVVKVKPSKDIFHLSLMVVSTKHHPVICKLNAILSYVLFLETILVFIEIFYILM